MKLLPLVAFVLCMFTSSLMAQTSSIDTNHLDDLGVRLPQPALVAPRGTQEYWVCTFNNRDSDWVPVRVGVAILSSRSASVVDSVLTHFGQSPVQASIYRNEARILGVRWRLRFAQDKRGRRAISVDYTLRFNKERNRVSLNINPSQFNNSFYGRGSCARQQS